MKKRIYGIIKKCKRPLVLVVAVLLVWNICMQVKLCQMTPKMDVYLPEDLYVAVGTTMELYNDQVVVTGAKDAFILNWECSIGHNMEDKFSVVGKEEQIGEYLLVLNIYDWNGRKIKTLTSKLHVVDQLEGSYSILNIGDSLSNGREWYRTIFYLSDGQITFEGTRGWTKYSHEGRAGFSPMDYVNETEYIFEDEGVHPFYDPVQQMFDWNYYKLSTGKDPDAVQIFLGINGLGENPKESVDAIEEMVNNIRKYDKRIPIYLVNTIYVGEQDILGSMELQNGTAQFQGRYKLEYDQKVMDLMQALERRLGNYSHLKFIPLALTHDSAGNFEMGDALHPNEAGDQQFAESMYSVYCGTLDLMLE